MSTKTPLFEDVVGALTVEEGVTTIEVLDWDTPVGIVIEPSNDVDRYPVVRKSLAGDFDQPVTGEKGPVVLSANNREAILTTPDIYTIIGVATTALTAYKLEV